MVILLYSLLALPLSAFGLAYYVYLPKYCTDILGISGSTLAIILLATRIFDAIIDPWIGSVSDRSKIQYGRRKIFIAIGIIPTSICFYFLSSPVLFSIFSPTLTLLMVSFAFFFFWSLISVPYEALGPEIELDFNKKNTVFAARAMMFSIGTIIASAAPIIFQTHSIDETLAHLQIILPAILCITAIPFLLWIHEKPHRTVATRLNSAAVKRLFTLPAFNCVFLAQLTTGIGAALPATLIYFFCERVLFSANAPTALGLYVTLGLLTTPAWPLIARKLGKRNAWITAILINTGAFLPVLFLSSGDINAFYLLTAISALGLGGTLTLPYSTLADVIEIDASKTGEHTEGLFLGVWSVGNKLAAAIGASAGVFLLDQSGYVSEGPLTSFTLLSISFLYAGVTCLMNLLSLYFLKAYTLDAKTYHTLQGAT